MDFASCAGSTLKRGRGFGTVDDLEVPKSSSAVQQSALSSTTCTTRLRTTTATVPRPVFAAVGEAVSFSLGKRGRLMLSVAIDNRLNGNVPQS